MNLLFLSTLDSNWGGSEELWSRTAKKTLNNGDNITLALFPENTRNFHIQDLLVEKATLIKIKSWKQIRGKNIVLRFYYFFLRKFQPDFNYKKILNSNCDILCISQADTFEAVFNKDIYNLLINTKKPFIIISQFNHEHFVLSKEEILRVRKVFDKAKKVLYVSKRNKEVSERQICKKINNAHIIDNPINLSTNEYLIFPQSEHVYFASVARFDVKFKGQDILFQVLSSDKWINRNWTLNLYGKGEDEFYLENLIQFYKLSGKVIFNGHTSNINNIWLKNHILLLPSLAEGKPLALEEAMICGRTAVVTDVAGNTELIQDNVNGFVASASTPKLFDEALERAWQNKEKWEEMGKAAHTWAIKNIDLSPEKTLYNLILSSI